MSDYNDNRNLYSNSKNKDPWRAESLFEKEKRDIFSSSDHQKHSDLFESQTSLSDDSTDIYSGKDTFHDQDFSYRSHTQKDTRSGTVAKKSSRHTGNFILSLLLIGIISIALLLGVMAVGVTTFVDDEIAFDLNNLHLKYTTLVYAKNEENKWIEVADLHGGENRIWVDHEEFPSYLTDAIVSIEDKRFYNHAGVDWKRTFGAFVNTFINIYGQQEGGSTITQQLVKNLTGDSETTASRKVQEIMRARKLENDYPKSTILECYVNTVHFGNGCDGIQTAASYYFGKDVNELTLLECASLAATIQTPNGKNPINGPEVNKERRELCLALMLEEGFITQEEYDAAMAEKLVVLDHSNDEDTAKEDTNDSDNVNSYFIDTLIENVISDLMVAEDCSYEEAESLIYSGGYRIYSSLNPKAQNALEKVYEDKTNFPKNGDGKYAQSAQTIMDYTGHIVAIAGGVGEKTADRSLNRAWQTVRQPGSSIKPLAVYTPAVEYNMLTYSSLIYDYHVKTAKGTYYPKDPGSGAYVTTQYAVQRSLNSTAVRICNALTPEKSFEFLKKRFGISTIVESEKTEGGSIVSDITLSSMALGGMAHGVTVSEMTAAYAAFGNLGMYYKPSTYYAVYDTFGDLVLKHQETGSQVVTPATANIMNRIMQTVVSGGTGGAASLGGWPVYGKTGTTDNKHDCWFAGGTPYYVSVVWCGYDNNYDLPSGSNPAPEIWRKTMSVVMEDLEKRDFNQSGDVIVQKYCTQTGCVAKSGCPQTSTGYYKSSYAPECSTHGGTSYSRGTQKISYGKSFANILQVPLPKADDWRNGEPAPSAKENKK